MTRRSDYTSVLTLDGRAVSGRLSMPGADRVRVLESGPTDKSPWMKIPVGFMHLMENMQRNWKLFSTPQERLNQRQVNIKCLMVDFPHVLAQFSVDLLSGEGREVFDQSEKQPPQPAE